MRAEARMIVEQCQKPGGGSEEVYYKVIEVYNETRPRIGAHLEESDLQEWLNSGVAVKIRAERG